MWIIFYRRIRLGTRYRLQSNLDSRSMDSWFQFEKFKIGTWCVFKFPPSKRSNATESRAQASKIKGWGDFLFGPLNSFLKEQDAWGYCKPMCKTVWPLTISFLSTLIHQTTLTWCKYVLSQPESRQTVQLIKFNILSPYGLNPTNIGHFFFFLHNKRQLFYLVLHTMLCKFIVTISKWQDTKAKLSE